MKKYFYADGATSFGPFSLEELKEKGITGDTMIWFQEIGEWRPAGSIPELSVLFDYSSPHARSADPYHTNSDHFPTCPKTWLTEAILVTIFCCWPFGIPAIVNAASVEKRFYAGDYEGAIVASANAKKWTKTSLWIAVAVWILTFVVIIATALA